MKSWRTLLTTLSFLLAVGAVFLSAPSALAAEVCTCTYTRQAGSGEPTSPMTYELSGTYGGYTIDGHANCILACDAWATNRSADSGLIYTITNTEYGLNAADAAAQAESDAKTAAELLTPRLSIDIPGLSLTSPWTSGSDVVTKFLPEYIAGVYRYALGIAAILAVVMIMIGGAQYLIGSSTGGEAVAAAKTRITNAITGLVLVLSAYLVLYITNPALTLLESLALQRIDPITFLVDNGDTSGSASTNDLKKISGIVCPENTSQSLYDVAQSFKGKVTYRWGGKGGPPPYSEEKKTDSSGTAYSTYCPENTVCADCSGFASILLACAGLGSVSGSTSSIFNGAETITTCSSTSVNGTFLKPGDLIGFKKGDIPNAPDSGHVYIYIGSGQLVDSHGSGRASGTAMGSYSVESVCLNSSYRGHLSIKRISK